MSNTTASLITKPQLAGMSPDEARIYTELVREPGTHLQLSRRTAINRTKVYRIVSDLQQRGLVVSRSDDRGVALTPGDPTMLNLDITVQEQVLKDRRNALCQATALLDQLQTARDVFSVYTYEGSEGMKQMQWHELKARGELLALGNVTVEQVVGDRAWSERFRAKTAEKGYVIKEIINRSYDNPRFTEQDEYMRQYESRIIPFNELPIETPIVMYNDTVSIYRLEPTRKFGLEITSSVYAATMRHIFEHYWKVASPS